MEKYEGYADENVLWNRGDVCECRLLVSRGSSAEDVTPVKMRMFFIFNTSTEVGKVGLEVLVGSVASAHLYYACMSFVSFSCRTRQSGSFFGVNNEFLIWAPHEILISGILAHRGRDKIKSEGRD